MDHSVDLSSFTFTLFGIVACIVPQIRTYKPRKTFVIRFWLIVAAVIIYATVVIINLQPIPANGNETVFITRTGSKYHSSDCRHLYQSRIETTLEQAIADGYGDCSHCYVPKYIPETLQRSFSDLYSSKGIYTGLLCIGAVVIYFGFFFTLAAICDKNKKKTYQSPNTDTTQLDLDSETDSFHETCLLSENSHAVVRSTQPISYCSTLPQELSSLTWNYATAFCNQSLVASSVKNRTYIGTAFFYAISKALHNQAITDEMYSYFLDMAAEATGCDNTSIRFIRIHYRQLRSSLNTSGIDPQTPDGIKQLWKIITEWVYKDTSPPDNDYAYFSHSTNSMIKTALDIYHSNYSKP